MMSLRFVKTCDACPEQYDVFSGHRQVGYVRLRWGNLTVTCPDVGGHVVYEATPQGFGEFEDEADRHKHLSFAAKAILDWIENGSQPPVEPPIPQVEFTIE